LQNWLVIAVLFLLTACSSRPAVLTPPSAPSQQPPSNLPDSPSPPASRAPAASTPTQAASSSTAQPSATTAPSSTPSPADICAPLPAGNGIPHYRFDVVADPIAHRLQVKQQIALADRERLSTGAVLFNVPANHAAGTFVLANARLAGSPVPLPANLSATTLRVGLPDAARAAPEITICLDYALNLPAAGGEGISAAHALGWSDLGMIAGYWHPVLAPHTKARGWLLTPYHPVGDPIVYETADYEVTVRAPTGHTVIGAGLQEVKDGVWRYRLDRARGFAFAVSDRLVASRADAGGIPVQVYHLAGHKAGAEAALRAVREALPLFAQTYGPYPYRELVIVEAPQFGGMEYSALITFSRDWFADYQPPAAGADFGADLLVRFIVHELGHQWWYGAVGNDQAYEPWVDEALARYGETLYYERLHPSHLGWWEAPSKGFATVPINQPIYNFSDTTSYVQAAYVSGTRFWLDVRKAMGEQAFHALLQDYRRRYQDRIVTEAELLAFLRERVGALLGKLLPVYFAPAPKVTPPS
jgi:hypothetical protein